MKISDILKNLKRSLYNTSSPQTDLKLDDILATGYINNLLKGNNYIPFTGWSLRPFSLAFILNEVLINNRTQIIEFGAGISTILVARLAKLNNIQLQISSIDHNQHWIDVVSKILAAEKLEEYVSFTCSPLKTSSDSENRLPWYSKEILNKAIEGKQFDLVLVDGPPADFGLERYPAIPFLFNHLRSTFSIFIDDAHREGEKKIIDLLEDKFNFQFEIASKTLAIYRKGTFFESNPVIYSVF